MSQSCHGAYFLENGAEHAANQNTPYVVLPAPYERTASFGRGTGRAPAAILAASRQLELFDEELSAPAVTAVQTLPPVDCEGCPREVMARLRAVAGDVMQAGRFLLTLGGEHSITAPLVAAARARGDVTVLHLDAHLDLRDRYEDDPLSHACVMRRVMDSGVKTVHVGIRSLCAEEHALVRRHALPVFWGRDPVCAGDARRRQAVLAALGDPVYLSLDVDVLDTGVMPGTGTPEPGGMSWYALLGLLRAVFRNRRVVAADIVETAPLKDTPVCEYAAARLAGKILNYHQAAAGGALED